MKKIVALALCLVLALSLCATAFAADKYTVANDEETDGIETLTYKAATGNYVARFYGTGSNIYVPSADGTKTLIINGTECAEVQLAIADEVNNYGKFSVVIEDVELVDKSERVCGDLTNDDLYVDAAGVYYTDDVGDDEDDYIYANYEGEIMVVEKYTLTDDDIVLHKAVVDLDDNGKVVGFTCAKCDATLDYTKSLQTALTSGNIYQEVKVGTTTYYVYSTANAAANASVAAASAAAVSSAKTFDAGIAMYVGMAISAVAGSAVVIGKKKEF